MAAMDISRATKLYGMTARALRFYEDHGLIAARRDHRNKRYYNDVALQRLAWIARLRRGGVGLDEIATVLDAPEDKRRDLALKFLAARRAYLLAELAATAEVAAEFEPPRLPANAPGQATPAAKLSGVA